MMAFKFIEKCNGLLAYMLYLYLSFYMHYKYACVTQLDAVIAIRRAVFE